MAYLVGSGESSRFFNGGQPVINFSKFAVSFLIFFLILSSFGGKAPGATNEAVNASPPAAADEKTSDASALPRDPFWPIGYAPASLHGGTSGPARPAGTEPGKKTLSRGDDLSEILKIGGVIRKGGRFYATINGFTVQTGEVVTAIADGEVYKFVVEKIDLKKVQIRPVK